MKKKLIVALLLLIMLTGCGQLTCSGGDEYIKYKAKISSKDGIVTKATMTVESSINDDEEWLTDDIYKNIKVKTKGNKKISTGELILDEEISVEELKEEFDVCK